METKRYATDMVVLFTAMVCLYSTGHWIGGSILLIACLIEASTS